MTIHAPTTTHSFIHVDGPYRVRYSTSRHSFLSPYCYPTSSPFLITKGTARSALDHGGDASRAWIG